MLESIVVLTAVILGFLGFFNKEARNGSQVAAFFAYSSVVLASFLIPNAEGYMFAGLVIFTFVTPFFGTKIVGDHNRDAVAMSAAMCSVMTALQFIPPMV